MEHTEERPMDAVVSGTIVVIYGESFRDTAIGALAVYLAGRYNFSLSNMREVSTEGVDSQVLLLEPQLYTKENMPKVEQALWVLEDVLGNVELEDWHTEVSDPIYLDLTGKFKLHTGNQHYMNVALRVLVVEPI